MNKLTQRAITYLNGIGLKASNPRPWAGAKSLPYYLRNAFELELVDVMGRTLLLAVADEQRHTASSVQSLFSRLQDSGADDVVYTADGLTATERKRLIERNISFLVPDYQLFLPAQGVADLRETYPSEPPKPVKHLSPSAQAMVLAALLRPGELLPGSFANASMHPHWTREWVPSDVARYLGYSAMTSSRAVRELVGAGLVEQFKPKSGHHVVSMVGGRRETWDQALPLLRSPVLRAVWMKDVTSFVQVRVAGESALAAMSQLAEPRTHTLAIDRNVWTSANVQDYELTPDSPMDYEVQVWSYTPRIVAHGETVDPLSLYLTLRENPDERVQGALEEMMEALPW